MISGYENLARATFVYADIYATVADATGLVQGLAQQLHGGGPVEDVQVVRAGVDVEGMAGGEQGSGAPSVGSSGRACSALEAFVDDDQERSAAPRVTRLE
ncbi:hypothetical protein [Streptomyces sp. NPDC051109]|uniref:hypothetical protein n=1 Tax=Streptomyces sp. NPDC051109 TaxID=3365642 RepID=UPI0037AFF283